uniref:CID domain-containing protein n=1 Tax=Leersia perrieri TaxID=77586 RepID=A0A0D9V9Q9_9ORYZ
MNAGFSPQILAQKLSKLNNSRQSIETPRERRVSLLYLANDIVQNSKKDSGRYVNEFWRVIPAALNDVFVNGDEFGRNVVQRLVDIWEERNIFGSHGQSLKEDYSRRFRELKSKSRNSSGELLEKVISCYKHMVNAHVDEDTLMRRCQNALSFVDNLSNEYENNSILDSSNGSGFVEELQAQHSILRDIIEQFKTSELLRGNLISCLKEALHEQEFRMERARSQIKEVQSRYKKADDLCQKLGVHVARQEPPNHGLKISGDNMEQKVENSTSKRLKLQNDVYVSQPQSPPPPLPSDAFQQPPPPPEHPPPPESTSPPPPPTSDPPPVPPPPPTTDSFMPVPAGPTTIPYNSYPAFSPLSYPMVNIPPPFPSAPNPPPGFRESILCPSFSRTTTTTSTTDEQEID